MNLASTIKWKESRKRRHKRRYSFEGTYTVAAEDRDEAKRTVNDDCGLVLAAISTSTRDDDEVLSDFVHPDTRILLQERGGKGSLPSSR